METVFLKDLVKEACGLIFVVCIGRIWEHWSADSSTLYGLDFVMVDRKGVVAEGVIPKDKIALFKNSSIAEGSVCKIKRNFIAKAKEKYRAEDHPCRLSCLKTTTVTPIVPHTIGFPVLAHNALLFSELEKRIGLNVLMSDTLGLIVAATDQLPPAGAARNPRRRMLHL